MTHLARITSAMAMLFASALISAAEIPRTDFVATVSAQFSGWDADHDGVLSVAEIDAAVADPALHGAPAAAIAALKRATRDPKLALPPLTLPYLQETAKTPVAAGKPDFNRMFKGGCDRLATLTARELFVGTPRLETIHQGKLGNCFSLAPLGALVHRDSASPARLIVPEKDGRYRISFGNASVVVAGPTDAEVALTSSNENAGLWVNIYEKALGTLLNDAKPTDKRSSSPLDALARGGSAGTILSLVTGHDIVRITFAYAHDKSLGETDRQRRTSELRQAMIAAVADHRLMTCGTAAVSVPGLTPNHAYAILDYDAKDDVVVLWNPHGDDFTPKGESGPSNGYPKKSGVFRMPVADWIAQFSGMAYEVTTKPAEPRDAEPPRPAKVDAAKFKIAGDPSSATGASWTYESTDDGIDYRLSGLLFRPRGQGPFPAVVLSHGQGQTAEAYGPKVAAEMTKWGLVCIAPNYTFAGQGKAQGSPGEADLRSCNPKDNVKRARKCFDLLATLGYVDMRRIAAHGHSMGAFLNVAIVGSFPELIKVASHTAGGEQPYNKELSLRITTPYSLHHGDADKNVALASDQRLEATLTKNGVDHELQVYPGMIHRTTSTDPAVLEHVRAWYANHGLFDPK